MNRPDDYDLYLEEGMKEEEARYTERLDYENQLNKTKKRKSNMQSIYADIRENFKATDEERLHQYLVRYLKINELKADEIILLIDFIHFYMKHQ